MMKNIMIAGMIGILFSGCTVSELLPGMMGAPSLAWSNQVARQCGVARNGSASPACNALADCVLERGEKTPLGDRRDESRFIAVVRAYYRIMPREDPVASPRAYTMSFLRVRAERAGSDAVALFSVMEQVRNTCIAQTGMTGKMRYE